MSKEKEPEVNKCVDCGAWHPLNEDELCEFCAEPEELEKFGVKL